MGVFSPVYDGAIELEAPPSDFAGRIARRVETGLLVAGSRRRANYVVRTRSPDAISFSAVGFWTEYNVGLNEVELRLDGPSRIVYHGSFRRWALYAAIHGATIALAILIGLLAIPSARSELSQTPLGWLLIGSLLVFFGLAWPWIPVAIHRRVMPRLLDRIVREAMSAPPA